MYCAKSFLLCRDETQTALNRVQTDLAASLADVSSVQTDLAAGAFDLAKANTNLAAVQTDLAAANTEARVLLHMCQQLQKQANNSACASVHLQATLKQCEQHR